MKISQSHTKQSPQIPRFLVNFCTKKDLKILQIDELNGNGHTFQILPYLNFWINMYLPLFHQQHLQSALSSFASWNIYTSPQFQVREKPKTYILVLSSQRETENIYFRVTISIIQTRSEIFCYSIHMNKHIVSSRLSEGGMEMEKEKIWITVLTQFKYAD